MPENIITGKAFHDIFRKIDKEGSHKLNKAMNDMVGIGQLAMRGDIPLIAIFDIVTIKFFA